MGKLPLLQEDAMLPALKCSVLKLHHGSFPLRNSDMQITPTKPFPHNLITLAHKFFSLLWSDQTTAGVALKFRNHPFLQSLAWQIPRLHSVSQP